MADSRSSNPFRRTASTQQPSGVTATPPLSTAATDRSLELSSSPAPVDPPPLRPINSDYFRQHLQDLSQSSESPPSTSFQKPKVVKKVRVQSPPPSSPESASGGRERYQATGFTEGEPDESSSSDDDVEAEDPFRGTVPPLGRTPSYDNPGGLTTNPSPLSNQQPPNPFSKTLEDIERSGVDGAEVKTNSSPAKGLLDVDAFRRLLMTGQTGVAGSTPSAVPAARSQAAPNVSAQFSDAASFTDASSISRQSMSDPNLIQETPRTSHEISEAEGDEERLGLMGSSQNKAHHSTASTLRKKPPPPSSRHGRRITAELSQTPQVAGQPGDENVHRPSSSSNQRGFNSVPSTGRPLSAIYQRSRTSSDVNKPLPPSPAVPATEDGYDSIFDREAAGKIPEAVDLEPDTDTPIITPRPPTPPNASHPTIPEEPAASEEVRKPVPPPRRTLHHRSESKASGIPKALSPAGTPLAVDDGQPRTSHESNLSRSSSIRAIINVPAPPPPRRTNHSSKPSTVASPSISSFNPTPTSSAVSSPAAIADHHQPPFPHPAPVASEAASPGASSLHHQASSSVPSQPRGKSGAPPPPPARHSSVRSSGRPASISSFDATSRRVGTAPPPPPPPKRSRAGSGRGSSETSAAPGRLLGRPVTEDPAVGSTYTSPAPTPISSRRSEDKSADEILADLDALQREVDALRGRYEMA